MGKQSEAGMNRVVPHPTDNRDSLAEVDAAVDQARRESAGVGGGGGSIFELDRPTYDKAIRTIQYGLEVSLPGLGAIIDRRMKNHGDKSVQARLEAILLSVAHYQEGRTETMQRVESSLQTELPVWSKCVHRRDRLVFPEMVETVVLYLVDQMERAIPGLRRKLMEYAKESRSGETGSLADLLALILVEREVRLSKQRAEATAILDRLKAKQMRGEI